MIASPRNTVAMLVLAAVTGALPIAPALAQTTPAPMSGMSADSKMAGPAAKANAAAMDKMNQAMGSAPMTGNADRDFVAMMMPHHQGAIDMAQIELQYGKDPVLRKMATAIVVAQKKEIAEMQAWLNKHATP